MQAGWTRLGDVLRSIGAAADARLEHVPLGHALSFFSDAYPFRKTGAHPRIKSEGMLFRDKRAFTPVFAEMR